MIYTTEGHLEGSMASTETGPGYQPDDLLLIHTTDGVLHAFLAHSKADGIYWREVGAGHPNGDGGRGEGPA